jgi:maltose-binding protein MalE
MRLQGKLLAAGLVSALAIGTAAVPPASAASSILVWADGAKVTGLKKLAADFKKANPSVTINVVNKTDSKAALEKLTEPTGSPDIVIGAHDWIGNLSANSQIVKISVSPAVKASFATDTLKAFSYNGNQYGMPMSVENLAWIQNAKIMGNTCPATLAAALKTIAAYEAKSGVTLTEKISVPGADPYHFYPVFSGLGGYVFGRSANGALDPNKVGLDNAKFLTNVAKYAPIWQKNGLFTNYAGKGAGAGGFDLKGNFQTGKSAVLWTGPWNAAKVFSLRDVKGMKLVFCPFPSIVPGIKSVPFSGVQGLMITKFANAHGVEAQAKSFLNFVAGAAQQTKYAAAAMAIPANKSAKAPTATLNGFKNAGIYAVPMPNIPQMNSVWDQLSSGWSKSLAKQNPSDPKTAWSDAADNVRDAVKG